MIIIMTSYKHVSLQQWSRTPILPKGIARCVLHLLVERCEETGAGIARHAPLATIVHASVHCHNTMMPLTITQNSIACMFSVATAGDGYA